MKTRLLILQPTPFCNIRCDYCYLPDRDNKERMAQETVRAVAERIMEDDLLGPQLTVVWHAGEPLAAPLDFYEAAFETLRRVLGGRCELQHSIQTNGMLIDDRWCEMFKRHGTRIGLSIDGPASLHDRHRQTRRGHGTHARAMRGARALQRHGIPFHVIAVVTAETLGRADDFAHFFAELGPLEVGCNFDEAEGGHCESSLVGHEEAHANFLRALLAKMEQGALQVRELKQAMQLIARSLPDYHWAGREWPDNAQVLPFALLNVAVNGDFGTFSPELMGQPSVEHENFVLGNVHRVGCLAAARGPAFARQWAEIRRGVELCRSGCAHFAFCGGGSPVNKLYEAGTMAAAETLYCRSMIQRPFDIVLESVEARMQVAVSA